MSESTLHTFPCKHIIFIKLGGKLYSVGKTVDTAKLIATDMPRVLRSEPGKRERDDTL
jgi:hypothetical protein